MKIKTILVLCGLSILSSLTLITALTINSPEKGTIYNTTYILFDIGEDTNSDFFYTNDINSKNWILLCKNIQKCLKKLKVKEGSNSFWVKTINKEGNIEISDESIFEVDSIKPKILKTFFNKTADDPANGNLFSIWYTEKNLKEIKLSYGIPGNIHNKIKTLEDCKNGANKRCDFKNLNMLEFDGQTVDVWFEISDGVNNVFSKIFRIKIDTTAPIKKYFLYLVKGIRINFIFEIEEKNFKDIIYKDINDCSSRSVIEGTLCKNLINGKCMSVKNFCEGNHNLEITVRDKAGNNLDLETINLEIV